jgi:hypothetical protein
MANLKQVLSDESIKSVILKIPFLEVSSHIEILKKNPDLAPIKGGGRGFYCLTRAAIDDLFEIFRNPEQYKTTAKSISSLSKRVVELSKGYKVPVVDALSAVLYMVIKCQYNGDNFHDAYYKYALGPNHKFSKQSEEYKKISVNLKRLEDVDKFQLFLNEIKEPIEGLYFNLM